MDFYSHSSRKKRWFASLFVGMWTPQGVEHIIGVAAQPVMEKDVTLMPEGVWLAKLNSSVDADDLGHGVNLLRVA